MASLVGRIRSLLLADASISARVGTRIYAHELPRGVALPAILLIDRDHRHEYSFAGPVNVEFADVAVTPVDLVRNTVVSLADDVRRVLDYYADTAPAGGVKILRLWLTNESANLLSPADGSETGYWMLDQQFSAAYQEV